MTQRHRIDGNAIFKLTFSSGTWGMTGRARRLMSRVALKSESPARTSARPSRRRMRKLITGLRRLAALAVLGFAELTVAFVVVAGMAVPVLAQGGWFPFFNNNAPQRRPSYQHQPQQYQYQQPQQYQWQQPQYQQPQQQPWQLWPQQQRPPRHEQPVDATKAPAPKKPEGSQTTHIAVLGDSMADWLGYGLEDAFSETPEIGVVRKNRANRGLILGTTKNEYDWAAVARETIAAEKPDFVVMMIGSADRQPMHVRGSAQRAAPGQKPPAKPDAAAKPDTAKPDAAKPDQPAAAKPDTPPTDQEAQAPAEEPPAAAEPASTSASTHEFRTEKWAEAYAKRVDEVLVALKGKGIPVFWVGLPAIRGSRATADMSYLNEIYRGRAEKAGAIYVDIWDGFVDENGAYAQFGADFEGQTRRLRTSDGVHFTKPGARKLAHYVEREIRRVMLARGTPTAMPSPEEPQPQAPGPKPGTPVARPVAGPVIPLTAPPSGSDTLLGGGTTRGLSGDALANRVLVRGEPVQSLRGRADDFVWPRQDGPPVASTGVVPEPPAAPVQANANPKAVAPADPAPAAGSTAPAATAPEATAPAPPPVKPRRRPVVRPPQQISPPFFGGPPRPTAPVGNNGRSAFWPYNGR